MCSLWGDRFVEQRGDVAIEAVHHVPTGLGPDDQSEVPQDP
jgi:hypothetical protein